jgi:hypothetical protein
VKVTIRWLYHDSFYGKRKSILEKMRIKNILRWADMVVPIISALRRRRLQNKFQACLEAVKACLKPEQQPPKPKNKKNLLEKSDYYKYICTCTHIRTYTYIIQVMYDVY